MNRIIPFLLLLIAGYSQAQERPEPLVTDRPDQTESTEVVPLESLQIETGFILENDKSAGVKAKSYSYNTTLLRYGLLKNMELRLGLDYLGIKTEQANTNSKMSGLSPLYAGFKIKVSDEQYWKPAIAFLGALNLPFTAEESYKPEYTGGDMRLSFSHTLSDNLALGYNLGAEWNGDTAMPQYFYSVSLGTGISEKLGAFIESYGTLYKDEKNEHLADAGLTYLLRENLQLDISGGIGLKNSIDNFFSLGITYRIPN